MNLGGRAGQPAPLQIGVDVVQIPLLDQQALLFAGPPRGSSTSAPLGLGGLGQGLLHFAGHFGQHPGPLVHA